MKTFTHNEREAAIAAIAKISYEDMGKMSSPQIADAVMQAISKAEGEPAGSGDRYLDAKNDLLQKIKDMNKSVVDSNMLGLNINIVDTNAPYAYAPAPAMPGMPGPLYAPPAITPMPTVNGKPQFKLTKLSKEFPIV